MNITEIHELRNIPEVIDLEPFGFYRNIEGDDINHIGEIKSILHRGTFFKQRKYYFPIYLKTQREIMWIEHPDLAPIRRVYQYLSEIYQIINN